MLFKRTLILLPLIFMLFFGAASNALAAPHTAGYAQHESAAQSHTIPDKKKKPKHHYVITIEGQKNAKIPEQDGTATDDVASPFTVDFDVDVNGALPNETYDVLSNMVGRCTTVTISGATSPASGESLGHIVVNFHGNKVFHVFGTNCVPNGNPTVKLGKYWISIVGLGGSATSFLVSFEIIE